MIGDKEKSKGMITDKTDPYFPKVLVTCPLCRQTTEETRHKLDLKNPFACEYCGILFEVRSWDLPRRFDT